MQTTKQHSHGFTLIEMALLLAVIGLVLGIFLQAYKIYQQERRNVYDRTVQEKVTRSMATYLQANGSLPCPASSDGVFSDANFGRAQNCSGSTPIAIGAIPVADLNLPYEMMADAYGNKMTYAVTTARTDPATYPNATDAVIIKHDDGATKNVPFVIVGHGPDGKGAYPLNSTAVAIPCGTTAKDSENCNDDTVFADNVYSGVLNFNSANRYDDSITYSLAQKETTLWLISPSATGVNIANRNTGNVGIGTSTPEDKLHVFDPTQNVNLSVNSAGSTAPGDITVNGQFKAAPGAMVEARDVEAGTSIFVKDTAKAGTKMIAKRYCTDVDVEDCN